MKISKQLYIHAGCIVAMLIVACVYFSPVLGGKALMQGDQQSAKAMAAESVSFHEATGEYTDWNSSMFSGMPSHQMRGGSPVPNFMQRAMVYVMSLNSTDLGVFFCYMLAFYLALVFLGMSPWLSLAAAVAFGLGSYNIIIILAGHVTKARCIALMMPIFAGLMLCLRGCRERAKTGRWPWGLIIGGSALFTVAITLQLGNNHIQITYYTMLGAATMAAVYFVYAIKEKWLKELLTVGGILLAGCALALACNSRLLLVTMDYAKYTMRGGSEISVTPGDLDQSLATPEKDINADGLNLDYAYSWSYGIGETYTLMVPGAMGGGSSERVGKESACYKNFHSDRMPLYWGDQPFTDGPVYFGVIVLFLFIFGLFVVEGPERWWLLIATILAIMLAWGRHFLPFNEWMFRYLPFYNKFRTPSMSLTLANVTVVLMAVLALRSLLEQDLTKAETRKRMNRALYISGGTTIGAMIIGLIVCDGFSYIGAGDDQMAAQYKDQWAFIQSVIIQDRKALFVGDSWRSIVFVALAAALMWLYINNKIKKAWTLAAPLALLIVIDLWGLDRRYISEDNFVKPKSLDLRAEDYDATIDQIAARMGDIDYRVLNLAVNTFNDAHPSAFHHQIGGYSPVKLRRYQDLIDFYLSRRINPNVLNMLNARYVVTPNRQVQRNPNALGNAWFVDSCRFVADANGEILALNTFDPSQTAIVDSSKWHASVTDFAPASVDSAASIVEEAQHPYNPGYLRYRSHSAETHLAVFSEVFYNPDWFAYIDGKPAEHFRANYILRAMIVPAGDHVIEFRNEAPLVRKLNRITILSQVVLLMAIAAAVACYYMRKRKKEDAQ